MKFKINENGTRLILLESNREEYLQLKLYLSPKVDNYKFKIKHSKHKKWDGIIDYFKNGSIDIGLWNEVYDCCKQYNYSFEIVNKELFPRDNNVTYEKVETFCHEFFKNHKLDGKPFMPYEHQINAVYKMLRNKLGLIEVATAGGKSLIASIFIFYILKHIKKNAKILMITPNISLVTQFYDDILDYNYGKKQENKNHLDISIMEIMSEKPRTNRDKIEPNIYIGTYQSLIKFGTRELYPYFYKHFDVVIIDESHTAGSKSIRTIMDKSIGYSTYRIGMSGTYPNKATAEMFAINAATGPKLVTVKAKELMDKGIISNVKIKAIVLDYDDLEFAKNVADVKNKIDGKRAFEIERKYAQNSEKRLKFIYNLANKKLKGNSLILFHNIEYGNKIYEYLRNNLDSKIYYIDGSISGEKREYIKSQMEIVDGTNRILVASFGTLSTGVSIKAIKFLVLVDSFKSDQIIRQSIGRVLRLHKNKEGAIVYDLVDRFHTTIRNILYNQFVSRRDEIYKKQQYPFEVINICFDKILKLNKNKK